MNACRSFRLSQRSLPSGVSTFRPSGEASQPGLHAPAGALSPNQARTLLRFGRIRSIFPQGRHRAFRSAAVGLAPRVLPLTPQVAFHLFQTTPFAVPPVSSDLIAHPWSSPGFSSRRLPLGSLIPRRPVSLFPSRLRHRQVAAAFFVRSEPLDGGPPHWLTVATTDLGRLCSPHAPKPRNEGHHSDSRPVLPTRTTLFIVSRAEAAHLLTSWSLYAGRNDPSRGSR
jgi:hypothetical protein